MVCKSSQFEKNLACPKRVSPFWDYTNLNVLRASQTETSEAQQESCCSRTTRYKHSFDYLIQFNKLSNTIKPVTKRNKVILEINLFNQILAFLQIRRRERKRRPNWHFWLLKSKRLPNHLLPIFSILYSFCMYISL